MNISELKQLIIDRCINKSALARRLGIIRQDLDHALRESRTTDKYKDILKRVEYILTNK